MYGRSMKEAGWIAGIPEGMEALGAIPVALFARKLGRPKLLLTASFGLYCVGISLMILFRQSKTPLYVIVAAQLLVGLATASFNLLASSAAASTFCKRDQVTVDTLESMFTHLGAAFGNALASAIWNHTVPTLLKEKLPAANRPQWHQIFSSLPRQLSHPQGDPTRTAIQAAYAEAQIRMLIGGYLVLLAGLGCITLMPNDTKIQDETPPSMMLSSESEDPDDSAEL